MEPAATTDQQEHSSSVADSAIRVDVVLLDKLMNLVGELVLAGTRFCNTTRRTTTRP